MEERTRFIQFDETFYSWMNNLQNWIKYYFKKSDFLGIDFIVGIAFVIPSVNIFQTNRLKPFIFYTI